MKARMSRVSWVVWICGSILGAASVVPAQPLQAQSLPDCRTPSLSVGSPCMFNGTTLPKQTYIGDISLPSSDHVRMTEPFESGTPVPRSPHGLFRNASIGAMFTAQTETLGYKAYVSSGLKVFANKQWSDLRGLDMRFTAVEFALGSIGILPGNNHTAALSIGPRIQHSFGPFTPYAEVQVGLVHQYYWGLDTGGVFGATVRLNDHWSLVPADVEYRYAALQDSSRLQNPRQGRIELSAGVCYRFKL